MTEILVSNATPETPAATNGAPPPAPQTDPATPVTPVAVDPAKAAADAALVAERQEMREVANAKAAAFRAQQEAKAARQELAALQEQRKADLDRITKSEAWEKLSPEEALAALENRGLTAQQLGRAAVQRGSPEEILKKAEAIAEAKAEAKLKAILEERDGEAKKKSDEADLRAAHAEFIKHVSENDTKYPAMASLVAAGPVLRRAVLTEAMHIYRLAGEDEAKGIHHSDDDIKQELEKYLASEYGVITQRISGAKSGTPSEGNTGSGTSPAKSAAAAPNVTNAMANGTVSLGSDLPKDFRSWSKDKQNAYFLDQVRPK